MKPTISVTFSITCIILPLTKSHTFAVILVMFISSWYSFEGMDFFWLSPSTWKKSAGYKSGA
jgi:hypothetical protein